MAEIDSLDIKISAEDNAASKKINSLAKALEKLDKALAGGGMETVVKSMEALNKSAGGLSAVEKAMKSVSDAANGIGKSVEAMKGVGNLLRQLGNVGKIEVSKNLPKRLKEIGKAVQSISPDALARLDTMTQYLSRLKGVSLRGVRDIAKAIPDTGKVDSGAVPDTPQPSRTVKDKIRLSSLFSSISEGAKTAIGYVNKFFSALSPLADKVLPKVGAGLKKLGKYLISSVTKPFKSAISSIGKWQSAIGRIAFYRMIRSAIRMITEGFSTGIKNLYEYSRLVGTEFAPAMNTLSTNALYLKNSLGAMAAPLIQAVVPAVETVINAFVSLLNIIGKVFAALSGKSTYTQAKKYATEYGEALDGAAGAAKALKDYTLGFDELNVFNDNGSGGGGGGGSGSDYASMFEEVTNPYADWAKSIRDAIANGDWLGAGSLLAEKLNSLLDRFRWREWGEKLGKTIQKALSFTLGFLRKFNWVGLGSKLAGFLNGAISSVNAKNIGSLLASKLRIGVELAFGFFTTFDWTTFGTWLSDIVNGWFEEIDWETVGRAITSGIVGLLNTLTAFLKNTDWDEIGKSIGEVLKNIDWSAILSALWDAFTGAVSGVFELLGGFQSELSGLSAVVFDIGIGFASWKVLSKMIPLLKKAGSNLKNIKKQAGITLSIVGFSVEWSGAFDIGRNGASLENVLKTALGSALGIVGSLMTFGTGPLGWAIGISASLIVAITGVVSGTKEKVEELQKQMAFDTFFDKQGVSIDTLKEKYVGMIEDIAGNTGPLVDLANAIADGQQSIDDTTFSVQNLVQGVETGAIKIEEAVPRIKDQLNSIYDDTQEKLTNERDLILDALFASVDFADKNIQPLVKDYATTVGAVYHDLSKEEEQLYETVMKDMETGEINTEDLERFLSLTQDSSSAVDDFRKSLEGFSPDRINFGDLDSAKNAINDLTNVAENALNSIDTYYDAAISAIDRWESMPGLTPEEMTKLEGLKNLLVETKSEKRQEIIDIFLEYLNSIQKEMVENIPKQWDKAVESYNGLSLWEKMVNEPNDFFPKQLDIYNDEIFTPLSTLIQSSMKRLGIEGKPWAQDAMDEVLDGLSVSRFDYYSTALSEDGIKSIMINALKAAAATSKNAEEVLSPIISDNINDMKPSFWESIAEVGRSIPEGFAKGIQEKAEVAFQAVRNLSDTKSELLDSSTEEVGKAVPEGLASGVKEQAKLALEAVKELNSTKSDLLKTSKEVGKSVPDGLEKGITENKQKVFNAVKYLGTESKNVARTSYDSHSPSRVFEKIGKDVDLGLELGIREKFDLVTTTVKKKLSDLVQTAKSYFESSVWADMARKASEALKNNLVMPELKPIELTVTFTTDVSAERKSIYQALGLRGWPKLKWQAYESGGFPKQGEIFIANERSAEMIGSIGNRTAVANNDQIVAGISDGVSEANRGVIEAMLEVCGRLIEAIEENRTDVCIGDEDIYKANRRYEQRAGTNTTKGAFAYVR